MLRADLLELLVDGSTREMDDIGGDYGDYEYEGSQIKGQPVP